eukprot:scaffold15196_cov121-Isochrysis_galbana.AAC.3
MALRHTIGARVYWVLRHGLRRCDDVRCALAGGGGCGALTMYVCTTLTYPRLSPTHALDIVVHAAARHHPHPSDSIR